MKMDRLIKYKNDFVKWAGKNHEKMKLVKNGLIGFAIIVVLYVMFFKTESTEKTSVKEYDKTETTQDDSVLYTGVKPEHNIQALTDMIYPFKEEITQDAEVHVVNRYVVESAELYLGSFIDNFVANAQLDSNLHYFIRQIDHAKYDTNVNYQLLIQNQIFKFKFK